MKKYLLPETGSFYKANLHCHSTYSDGFKTPAEIKEIYMDKGYSVIAYTDHDIYVPHDELTDENFVALHGFEIELDEPTAGAYGLIKTCHICLIGIDPENITQPFWNRNKYHFFNKKYIDLIKTDDSEPDYIRRYGAEGTCDVMETAREKGFFVTYNHPTWSKESYNDYIHYNGMHAIEMFNGACLTMGYDDYNHRVYDDLLMSGKRIYCIGADDNHNSQIPGSIYCECGVAFTMIKAEKLEYREITKALVDGNFYASEGPEIHSLWYEDGKVHITCSAAKRINCNYHVRKATTVIGDSNNPITSAEFSVPADCGYFRLTVIDENGKHACTNAYFVDELLK